MAALTALSVTAACVTPPPQTPMAAGGATALICSSEAVDFTVRDITPAGLSIDFAASQFDMTFIEHTTAGLPTGPVSLTTYLATDAPDPFRLTLAHDGITVRARLMYAEGADLSAQCTAMAS